MDIVNVLYGYQLCLLITTWNFGETLFGICKFRRSAPKKVIGDWGIGNWYIVAFQRYFGRDGIDELAAENSFLCNKIVLNQWREPCWSQIMKSCTSWRIHFFKDLIKTGVFYSTKYLYWVYEIGIYDFATQRIRCYLWHLEQSQN